MIVISLTAGDTLLMWFGEMITEKGCRQRHLGHHLRRASFPAFGQLGQEVYSTWFVGHPDELFLNILKVLILLAGIVVIFALIVFVQQAERKIPVQYAKRVVGRTVYSGQQTHIPLKVNAAGVIPVIFAVSLLILPYTIASYFQTHHGRSSFERYLYPNSAWYHRCWKCC